MSHVNVRTLVVVAIGASALIGGQASAQEGPAAVEKRVAALKQSIQESQARLRKYEWIETTIISLKGEEKDRKQQRCYYGADGKVQKVLLSDEKSAAPKGGRLKQKIVANKTSDMKEYMERAGALVQHYVPPFPGDIDNAKKAGNVALRPGQGGRVRLEFTNYLKAGDLMTVDVDAAANALVGLSVNSYLDTPDDAVTLNVGFASLADGASYTAQTTLDAKAKNITVVIQNSGHRPAGR